MGYSAQVQQTPNQSSGKGSQGPIAGTSDGLAMNNQNIATDSGINSGAPHQAIGKGGNYSMSATSGQPQMGAPNAYPNTVGMGDNTQQQLPKMGIGKGKV